MITIEEVYVKFMKHRAFANGRGYNLPKEPSLSVEKLKQKYPKHYETLRTLTGYFNTKWQNIDLDKYFQCAFKLMPTISYNGLLNDKILKQYIQLDKIEKFHSELDKRTILNSFKNIKTAMKMHNISSLKSYGSYRDDKSLLCIDEYIKGFIDSYVFVFLILKKYVILNNEDKDRVGTTLNNISKYKIEVMKNWDLLCKLENTINMATDNN